MGIVGTKFRRFGIVAVAASLLVSCWLYWNREPRYRGVAASSYVLELIGPSSSAVTFDDGLREMGPEMAVPALIRVIETHNSSLARRYQHLYSKVPAVIAAVIPVPPDRHRITSLAVMGLEQFGPEASASVPTLISIYNYKPREVTETLSAIGPPASNAISTLIRGLHPTNTHCFATVSALWRIDPSGDLTARAFTNDPTSGPLESAVVDFGLQRPGSQVRFAVTQSRVRALEMLSCLRSRTRETAPFMANLLRHQDPLTRAKAAEALGRLGPVVQKYAKEIRPLLTDERSKVREAATNSLKAIEISRP